MRPFRFARTAVSIDAVRTVAVVAALWFTPVAQAADVGAVPPVDTIGVNAPMVFRPEAIIAAHGDGRGQVLEPAGIAADAFGRVYVSDAAMHRLQRLDAAGKFLGEAGSLGSRAGELHRPGAVALLGALGVAVLDRENRRIVAYDMFGRFQGILSDLSADELIDEVGRVDPVAMATDRGGAIYVVDADRDRLLVFDFTGRYLRTIGGFGSRPGSFRGLAGVAVGADGVIVTAERGERRVQRLDAGGRPIAAWSIDVARAGDALALAVDDSGRVVVGDPSGDRLVCYSADGAVRAVARVSGPRAAAFTAEGRLLVAERGRVSLHVIGRTRPAGREE